MMMVLTSLATTWQFTATQSDCNGVLSANRFQFRLPI